MPQFQSWVIYLLSVLLGMLFHLFELELPLVKAVVVYISNPIELHLYCDNIKPPRQSQGTSML